MAKVKSSHPQKSPQVAVYFILSFLILLTLVLLIFFIKQIYVLSAEINLFKSGQKTSYLNKGPIVSVKIDGANNFTEEKYFSLPEGQQSFDDLSFKASPDGSNFAYINRGNPETLYINGKETVSSEKISFIEFSSDGKRLAYGVKVDNKDQVILDGQPGQVYDWIFAPYFFTPDNRYFIYKARKNEGDVIVFNNIESRPYDQIYSLFITSDKKQLVFYARAGLDLWKTTVDLKNTSLK